MTSKLIVCADDLGLHPSIDEGIFLSHEKGVVTSAGLVPNGENFEEAVREVKKRSELEIGLHLTLFDEKLLCDPAKIPSLYKASKIEGHYIGWLTRCLLGFISIDEIEMELRAQFERLIKAGIKPVFVNSHRHVHVFPPIAKVVLRLMNEYGVLFARIYGKIECHLCFESLPAMALSFWSKAYNLKKVTDRFLGFYDSGHLTENNIESYVRLKFDVAELMCHPGIESKSLRKRYGHWSKFYSTPYSWEGDYNAITSTRFRDALESKNIKLTAFRDAHNNR